MIKIENVETAGFKPAFRGMRNALESWSKSDSVSEEITNNFVVGDADKDLAMRLRKAGSPSHRKYLRMINVWCDITAGHTWWAEFDTYKVGTVRNSCSKMHKIHVHTFTYDMFDHEGIDELSETESDLYKEKFQYYIKTLEDLRVKFNETQNKAYWRALVEMLPMGFHLKSTVEFNYENLTNMYNDRKMHKMQEWRDFCKWVETLPYSYLITGQDNK